MKERQSKLDPHEERLDEWFQAGKTLAEVQAELKADGCSVSLSRLSEWLSNRRDAQRQAQVLLQISSGAKSQREVEEAFAKNPAPGMEVIANLHRLLSFQLATMGVADPKMIELSHKCTQVVLEFGKLAEKKEDRKLTERRVKVLESKLTEARGELQKLRDPKAPTSEEERKAIVDKVDEVLGLK